MNKPFITYCVSCGEPIGCDPQTGLANHRCSKRHEAAKAGANTRLSEHVDRSPTFAQRLAYGFSMTNEAIYDAPESI